MDPDPTSAARLRRDPVVPTVSWPLALVVLLVLAVYRGVGGFGFVFDDAGYLTENPLLRSVGGLGRIWLGRDTPDYYPVTYTWWWLQWQLFGASAGGYHLVQLGLHLGCVLMLWRVLERWRLPWAWLAAGVFALHPVNVATVAWVSEQKNTLAMLFALGAMHAYTRLPVPFLPSSGGVAPSPPKAFGGRDDGVGGALPTRCGEDSTHPPPRTHSGRHPSGGGEVRRRWARYGLALVLFALALLSKPSLAGLPVVLLLVDRWQHRSWRAADWWRSLPFFGLSLGFGLLAIWFQHHRALEGKVVLDWSWSERLGAAAFALVRYWQKAVWPARLGLFDPDFGSTAARIGSAILVVVVAVGLWLGRRRTWARATALGLGVHAALIFPMLPFFDQGFFAHALVADHWQYFALPGLTGLVAAGVGWAAVRSPPTRRWVWWALAGTMLVALSLLSARRVQVYRSQLTLWQDTVAANPGSWLAHYNLGNEELARGRFAAAATEFQGALRLNPAYDHGHNNLAVAFYRQGRVREAIAEFRTALRLHPDWPEVLGTLAWVLATDQRADLRLGDEAVSRATRACVLTGYQRATLVDTLAAALAEAGRFDEARSRAAEAERLATTAGDTALVAEIRRHRAAYDQGRAWRE